jgi:hypothetical protein
MDISLTVLPDMRLVLEPVEVARDAEHHSATFRIVKQPAALDQYVCRAEVSTAQGSTYRLVEDSAFDLTTDIAVAGVNHLQLVYGNGGDVQRKTALAAFHVSRSINALEPSDPDYPADGIAQLQAAAFARVVGSDTAATFYNLAGQAVGVVVYPPGQGGGLDEAAANLLYLRLDGATPMNASLLINGSNRGVVFDPTGAAAAIYADGVGLRLRRAVGNTDVTIEDNSGLGITRSPILTLATGDGRYLTEAAANLLYLRLAGGFMTGDILMFQTPNLDARIGIQLGGRGARVEWDAGIVLRRGQANESVYIADNVGAGRSEVITQALGDTRYLPRTGGELSGMLICARGTSSTNLALGIGDNTTGFWRTGNTVIFTNSGNTQIQFLQAETMFLQRLNMALYGIANLADPVAATDATNRRYVDGAIAAATTPTAYRTNAYTPAEITIGATATQFLDVNFPMPATAGFRNILININPVYYSEAPGGTNWQLGYTTPLIALDQPSMAYKLAQENTAMFRAPITFTAAVDPSGGTVRVQLMARVIVGQPTLVQVGTGGTSAPSARTIVTISDLGPIAVEEAA